MSFYDNEGTWSAPGRQSSWEQQPPPSRSGTGSAMSHQSSDANAFAAQFEEIERANDNLMRSGKMFPGQVPGVPSPAVGGRRDSMPGGGRGFDGFGGNDPRSGGPSRHHSVSEYDGGRPGSAGLQGYYAGQRYPGGRQSEAEQVLQAKRRMAAARERELRNYHQEQQYNRSRSSPPAHAETSVLTEASAAVSGVKSDRSMSPNAMSEEDRRELIARQHRALYGDNSSLYGQEGAASRPQSQDARVVAGPGRGPSPLAFDPYGVQTQAGAEGGAPVQMPPRDRAESTTSPAANAPQQPSFAPLLNESQQASRTSNSSPGASPPLGQGPQKNASGVAPIGTRPTQPAGSAGALNKRSTTPLTPSSLSYGYTSADSQGAKDERSISTSSTQAPAEKGISGLGNWGGSNAAWGSSKNTLAVQPSVWG